MWQEIMKAALNDGLIAVLFCALFFYQLKDAREREKKYCLLVEGLTERLKTVENIERVCVDIKSELYGQQSALF